MEYPMQLQKRSGILSSVACTICFVGYAAWPGLATAEPPSLTAYEPSVEYPYGQPNPDAPDELVQYGFMIGEWRCDERLRQQDGSWIDTSSVVRANYFLDGYGILNHSFLPDKASVMTYQYNSNVSSWGITNLQAPDYKKTEWVGKKDGATMVATRDATGPSGAPITLKISFFNIEHSSFNWTLEAVTPVGSQVVREKACSRTGVD